MAKKFETDSIGGGVEAADALPKGASPTDMSNGRAVDANVYGTLPDEVPSLIKLDTGRKVAQPMALAEIRPDPRQPRRAIPALFMRLGDGDILTALELWASDAGRHFYTAHERVKATAMAEMIMETVMSNDDLPGMDEASPQTKAFVELAQLARTIHADGLINPISIGKAETGTGYWVESGERRFLAYTLLSKYVDAKKFGRIPAIVGERVSVWKQAAENGARRPLNAIGMARQLALLVMDMYPETSFEALDELNEQAYYAQVADGNKWRILPAKLNDVLAVTGLKSMAQVSQYRRLLKIPNEIWQEADAEDWGESKIREEAFPTAPTLTTVKVAEPEEVPPTITTVMVADEWGQTIKERQAQLNQAWQALLERTEYLPINRQGPFATLMSKFVTHLEGGAKGVNHSTKEYNQVEAARLLKEIEAELALASITGEIEGRTFAPVPASGSAQPGLLALKRQMEALTERYRKSIYMMTDAGLDDFKPMRQRLEGMHNKYLMTGDEAGKARIIAWYEGDLKIFELAVKDLIAVERGRDQVPFTPLKTDAPRKPRMNWNVPIEAIPVLDTAWKAGQREVIHGNNKYAVIHDEWVIVKQGPTGDVLAAPMAADEMDDPGAMAMILAALKNSEMNMISLIKATGKSAGTVTRAIERLLKRGDISERRSSGADSWIIYGLSVSGAAGASVEDEGERVVHVPDEIRMIVRFMMGMPEVFNLNGATDDMPMSVLYELAEGDQALNIGALNEMVSPAFGWLESQLGGLLDILGNWYKEASG
jgi:hypothetical protein